MKISPIIKPNQNKVNINQIHKAIVNSNIISKTKQAYNKITVKSLVPQNNNSTQKQIIDIASQKLIKIVKDMTEAEMAFLAEKKGYVKNNIIKKTRLQAKKNKNMLNHITNKQINLEFKVESKSAISKTNISNYKKNSIINITKSPRIY